MNDHKFSRFLIVWSGQLLSNIGSGLTAFALGVYVFRLTGSAANYSLVLLASFLPSFLLKPIGGTLADRINRKLLMIVGDLGSALGVVFIIWMMWSGVKDLWVVYFGAALSSTFVAFQNPAYKASVTDLVDQAHYSRASGLMQLAESAKFILSPVIAGALFAWMRIENILAIDVLTFLFAMITVYWVKKHDAKKLPDTEITHFLTDLKAGFQYTLANKGLVGLLLITSVITFFIGILQALFGPMILSFTTAKVLGTASTIAATGMLISSLLIGAFSRSNKKIPILVKGLFFVGLFFALIGVSPNIVLITLFAFLFFSSLPFVNTSLDVLVRRNVDNKMQGRVWSIVSLISQFGMVVAFGIAGFIADHIFIPLLEHHGALASTVGRLIGTGSGRGIGLMFILSGLLVAATSFIVAKMKVLRQLDADYS